VIMKQHCDPSPTIGTVPTNTVKVPIPVLRMVLVANLCCETVTGTLSVFWRCWKYHQTNFRNRTVKLQKKNVHLFNIYSQ
jgi:hypothetical protein